MLSGIFGKKSDHPLADIKSVQELLDNLPRNDAYKSLAELTELIELLTAQADFKLDYQFAVLRMLDEAAQAYSRKLAREYFTPFEINKFHENRLWMVLDNFSRQVAHAYFKTFTRFCDAEKGSNNIKAQLPLLNARAINAMVSQLKYASSRYAQFDNTLWSNLARLLKHAEQLQYVDTPVRLYPGTLSNTSVKCSVGTLLVWYDCGLNALSPLYIHLTERLVAQYCSSIEIRPEVGGYLRLCFDLNNPTEPARINMGATTHPAMRFIGMPTMQSRLEGLMKVLNKNIVPDEINLGGNYEADVIKEALQHLLTYLIAPPVRRNARRMANVTLNVINGFESVFRHSADPQSGAETPARWLTEEISAGGFSSALLAGNDGIGIGSLLGIQPDGLAHWGVAVVRRLLRDDTNRMNAGAEILANQVAGVYLDQHDSELGNGHPALWLYAKPDKPTHGVQLLLMRADTFSSSRSLKIALDEKNYLLMPIGLQEKGLDYDLAKFKLIEQEVDSEVVG